MDFLREHPYYSYLRPVYGSTKKSGLIFVQGDAEYLNEDIVSQMIQKVS